MRRFLNRPTAEQGMTLAECAAALFVLAVGVLAGMQLVLLSVSTGDRLQRDDAARTLLAGRLDELLALAWDDPGLRPGGSLEEPRPGFSEEVLLDGRAWFVCRRVTVVVDGRKLVSLALVSAGGEGRPGPRLSGWVVR